MTIATHNDEPHIVDLTYWEAWQRRINADFRRRFAVGPWILGPRRWMAGWGIRRRPTLPRIDVIPFPLDDGRVWMGYSVGLVVVDLWWYRTREP